MSTVRVSDLGLNSSEQRFLQEQIATAASQQGSSSSRAASRASSQGRLLLDPTSLQALGAHFDRLMYSIQQRWQYLTQQTQTATQIQYDRAGNAMQMADAEIARFRSILREIDELQVEFDKVRRIGEIVKGFKSRVDYLDRRF
ncbi:uncharacterized protein M421DRAFT_91746 [Didymella exigua CBS 183.55]|uniref:Biogenesis of lysosome-related organelles complex 1 subunit CNL1 n=1 Tax=Didymella exigua CBS 183.55 TaxID=1150837 RepID=A0A6A5RPA9_9PLEO|nr:uncharacterized protein M421DRAFT_91746 [Didymella exigua CBS 183.55]KAF1929253.1 hypothetical protein M421DRAFT_91746 [Didymella exigua CBS 183.55]